LINKVHYLNDKIHGQWTQYYSSGNIECITDYEFDLKNGLELCFYENGNKRSERQYKEGRPLSEVIRWKQNGELIK
tara:strand:+ start:209 stop:436 length:228 start_codon:yes stop_codon:yes gene_type:complete